MVCVPVIHVFEVVAQFHLDYFKCRVLEAQRARHILPCCLHVHGHLNMKFVKVSEFGIGCVVCFHLLD